MQMRGKKQLNTVTNTIDIFCHFHLFQTDMAPNALLLSPALCDTERLDWPWFSASVYIIKSLPIKLQKSTVIGQYIHAFNYL